MPVVDRWVVTVNVRVPIDYPIVATAVNAAFEPYHFYGVLTANEPNRSPLRTSRHRSVATVQVAASRAPPSAVRRDGHPGQGAIWLDRRAAGQDLPRDP